MIQPDLLSISVDSQDSVSSYDITGAHFGPPAPSETWTVFTLAHLPVSAEASRSVLSYVYPSVKAPLCGRRRGKRTLLTEDVTEIESFFVLFFFQAEGRAELRNMLR